MLSATNGARSIPSGAGKTLDIPSQLSALPKVTAFVESILEEAGCPYKVCMQIDVAIDEVFSNIARYSGASSVQVQCSAKDGSVVLRFADDGMPYDPLQAPEPDLDSAPDERAVGGLGIFMVKKIMDGLSYAYENKRNVLTLNKNY